MRVLDSECGSQRDVPDRQDLIREGDGPGPVFVILEGWACRYKLLPEGTRQITSFLMYTPKNYRSMFLFLGWIA
jgi:CRP-like cAMP-binding protein